MRMSNSPLMTALRPFTFDDLEECLDFAILYEEAHGNRQIRDYCSQMLTRFKSLTGRTARICFPSI